jgi:hypothetical protein
MYELSEKLSYFERRIEDRANDPAKAAKFVKIYGHYCGPGNEGGTPIDGLDAACKDHDECYDDRGYHHCTCDERIIADIGSFLQQKKLTFKQRTYGVAIKKYFERKLKKNVNKQTPDGE